MHKKVYLSNTNCIISFKLHSLDSNIHWTVICYLNEAFLLTQLQNIQVKMAWNTQKMGVASIGKSFITQVPDYNGCCA